MKTNRPDHFAAQRYASLSRRRFLRGLGACVALPALESLLPARLFGAESSGVGNLAKTASGAPLRMAYVYFPNGAIQPAWWPEGEGKDFELGRTMQPLAKVKHQLQILGGLDHVNATPGPDGAGDHARAGGTFLTGVRVKKTAGSDIRAGISIDQVVDPATAIPVTPAPTNTTSPGARPARPWRRSRIHDFCSSGCLAPARPASAPKA